MYIKSLLIIVCFLGQSGRSVLSTTDQESSLSEYAIHTLEANFTLETPLTVNSQQHCLLVSHASNDSHSGLPSTESSTSRNVRILIFAESRLYPLFYNWLQHYTMVCTESGYAQLEIVCMDIEVHDMVSRQHLHCSSHSFQLPATFKSVLSKQSYIWIKRIEISIQLLEQGFDLILSDIDAIWRKDPFQHISRLTSSSDIISSRGIFPLAISSSWGAALCMGFIYFQSNAVVVDVLKETLRDMRSKEIKLWKLLEIERLSEDFNKLIKVVDFNIRTDLIANMSRQSIGRLVDHINNPAGHSMPNVDIVIKSSPYGRLSDVQADTIDHSQQRRISISIEESIYELYKNETIAKLRSDLTNFLAMEDNKPDDQWSINSILHDRGLRWKNELSVEGNTVDQHGSTQWKNGQGVRVTLLSHKEFLRHCSSIPSAQMSAANIAEKYSLQEILRQEVISHAFVAHCLTRPGSYQKKIKFLQSYGLWQKQREEIKKSTSFRSDELRPNSGNRINKLRKRGSNFK